MVTKQCIVCGATFRVKPYRTLTARTCSPRCGYDQRMNTAAKFWSQVEKTSGCWLWVGRSRAEGYGHIRYRNQHISTHRLSWVLAHGTIPDGLSVLHKCDNRLCVRPSHLFLGTQADNMRDMANKNRQARGERNGSAKLTADQVREIRQRYAAGDGNIMTLGPDYGVSASTIHLIVTRKHWKDVA